MSKMEIMAPADAVWLHMEHPTNLMFNTGILQFSQPFEFETLRQAIGDRLSRFGRFRKRVRLHAGPLGTHLWQTDPNFDSDNHIHHFALPAPGTQQTLQHVVSDLISMPLDRSKPLWDIHYIEGLGEGCALIVRAHHCIADGIALIYVLLALLDEESDGEKSAKKSKPRANSPLEQLFRLTQAAGEQSVNLLQNPAKIISLLKTGLNGAVTTGKMLSQGPDSKTFLKGDLQRRKQVAWTDTPIPLAEIKAIGKSANGTINDVLLTMLTTAMRSYLARRGEDVDALEIRVIVPVSMRPFDKAYKLGNQLGTVMLGLPIEEADPLDQLKILKARMDAIKKSPEAFITFGTQKVIGLTPRKAASKIIQGFNSGASAIMTNVPGPRKTLYLNGQPMQSIMAWGPLGGRMGLGVTILSYDGGVTLGIFSDAKIIPDPQNLLASFTDALQQLKEAIKNS